VRGALLVVCSSRWPPRPGRRLDLALAPGLAPRQPPATGALGRLLLWFTWPAWPLALWTVWRWRRQLARRHVACRCGSRWWPWSPRSPQPRPRLLLSLPALAALAAFALPTFERSVSALIDWFTLLFFSGCALVIWVIWISMQTGIPAKPAANVAKLAPGFVPAFGWLAFVVALARHHRLDLAGALAHQRSREAIWKSLVLPAGGAALAGCW
jgi:hypothetical protein